MSYGNQEYGGGGGASNNYYDRNQDFSGRNENSYEGRSNEGYGREESYGRQEGRHSNYDDDFSGAASHAQEHHSSEDKSLFSSALNFIQERKGQYSGEVDEQHAVNSHQAMYGSGSSGQTHDSGTVGAGAAMQALKMFTGGSSGGSESSGMDKNKLIGLAMAQAGKLWDEKQSSGGNMVCFWDSIGLRVY